MLSLENYMLDFGRTAGGALQVFLRWILYPIYWWIERGPQKRIPANNEPLLKLSATKLAQKIRKKELKSETIVRAYINRIREVNPVLNAIVQDRFNEALEEAKAVDKMLLIAKLTLAEIEKKWPLLGVPMSIKESCGVEGLSHCVGLKSRVGVKCTADGEAVALIKAAGAIPLAATTTPELCLSWECINLVTGRTVNPFNTNRTSGGSSGGEGALLGAGASVAGLGSDIAGSIRVPAHFNGIFGHKPTGGIVSVVGHYPTCADKMLSTYLVIGPMTRYAEDMRLIMKIIAGENVKKLKLDTKVDISKLTVFHMDEMGDKIYMVPVQQQIQIAVKKVVSYLEDKCGANISTRKFPELYDSVELSVAVFFSELKDIPNILQDPSNPKENRNLLFETLKALVGLSEHSLNIMLFYILKEMNGFVPQSKVPVYKKMFEEVKEKLEKALGTNGILIYPTFPIAAFHHYGLFFNTSGVAYTMLFNLMGFPSTHVPLGLDDNNLPIGLQVIAACNQDHLCLSIAEKLEQAFGGWIPPPMTDGLALSV